MEDSQILSLLASDDSDSVKKAILSLHDVLAKNNGILLFRDLQKLKNWFLRIIQNTSNYDDEEVLWKTFEFLEDFMTENYGSDVQIQFLSHIVPALISSWLTLKGNQLEAAQEALSAYIKSYKQLESVLDILINKHLNAADTKLDSSSICAGINLAVKNIEYHPKIISANSKSFISFIQELLILRNEKDEPEVSKQANIILMNFLKRFPATMKEIANILDNRDEHSLSNLIKLRNDTLDYKKSKKRQSEGNLIELLFEYLLLL